MERKLNKLQLQITKTRKADAGRVVCDIKLFFRSRTYSGECGIDGRIRRNYRGGIIA